MIINDITFVDDTEQYNTNIESAFTIWFTGLSGAGKSTLAKALQKHLRRKGINAALLDGDCIRNGLCQDLRFTEMDRCENIRRVSEVAKIINRSGIVSICACISPFQKDRLIAKEIIGDKFIEIYVNTPLTECERRDRKGLYKKARLGVLSNFTGIDSPYEPPEHPDIKIDTTNLSIIDSINFLLKKIETINIL